MPARHHAAARVWGSIAASALVAGSLVAIGAPALGAPAPGAPAQSALRQGLLLGDSGTAVTSVGLTDRAVYAATSAGIVSHDRAATTAGWSPVQIGDAPLTGALLAAEGDALLVDDGTSDTLAWRAADGTWSARSVPTGTTLGRGGAYAVLPSVPTADGAITTPIEDVRTGDVVWDYPSLAGTAVTVEGGTVTGVAASHTIVNRSIESHAALWSKNTVRAYTRAETFGRWLVPTSAEVVLVVRDLNDVYWGFFVPDDAIVGRDVAVSVDSTAHELVVDQFAGDDRSYGPASSASPDLDDAGTAVVYVDDEHHARFVDLSDAPRVSTTIVDHAAPDVPFTWVDAATSDAVTVTGHANTPLDEYSRDFLAIGGVVTEMRYRQSRPGSPFGAWSQPRTTTTLSVRAIDGGDICFAARAHDAAGNYTRWSDDECTHSDLTPPRLTKVSTPAAAAVSHGHATPSVTYAATDVGSVPTYDVRYKVRARGAGTYGAWVYRSSFQGTTSTKAAVTISTGQRICFSVRARDAFGRTSAWSSSHCLGTDVAAPRMTRISVPTWRGVPASGKVRSTVTYAATDDRGVASYDVRARVATATGTLGTWKTLASHTTKRSVSHTLQAGRQACYEVRARDAIGRVSAWSKPRCTYVAAAATSHALDAERVATRGGHKVAVLSSALPGGSGSGRSTSASIFTQESRGVRIQVRTCPSCGTFNVQVGKKVMTVRTKSSTTGWKYVTLRWKSRPGYVFFDEVTPYPHPRATSSYLRSWTLIRSQ